MEQTTWIIYPCFGSYVAIEAKQIAELQGVPSIGRIVTPSEATSKQAVQSWNRCTQQ